MARRLRKFFVAILTILSLGVTSTTWAGPPFVTDDPEPVDYQHWEVDFFSIYNHAHGSDSGQVPAVEVDYGAWPNVQLHVISPVAYDRQPVKGMHYGYGDTELGVKYRFVQETDSCPQVGVFPLLELPTGDSGRGLGNGQTQIFTPLWLQKSFGAEKEWTTYGGGGWWYNPGVEHRNFMQIGWELQRDIGAHLTLGGEIYHLTPSAVGAGARTVFNLGGNYNFDEHRHLLFSAGRDIVGPNQFSCYLGFQLTI